MSASDADKTRQVVREYLAERDSPCPKCGYNLRGLDSDKCPECGEPAALAIIVDERRRREAADRADARRTQGPWWVSLPGMVAMTVVIGATFLKGPVGLGRSPRVPTWAMLGTIALGALAMALVVARWRGRLAASAPGRLVLMFYVLLLPVLVVFLLWAL